MPKTVAVNVKRDDYDIYMGRAMPGYKGSAFANPFHIGKDGTRSEVIAKYKVWLLGQPELLAQLELLRGKRLGCWCKPRECHVDILVELLEGPAQADSCYQGALF